MQVAAFEASNPAKAGGGKSSLLHAHVLKVSACLAWLDM